MTEHDVERHYGASDISARIFAALAGAGKDLTALTRADLSTFDEFHGGGVASTRELARYAGLRAGQRVLDVGCGIGGPARTLAAEFGCRVSGLDLTPAFVRAATELTARVDLAAACSFRQGSATGLPYAADSFDVVWSQNMLMNVADKARFFDEVARVLVPGGIFAFEAVLSGNDEAPFLPAFWAAHPGINFLVGRDELERLLEASGLLRVALDDTTAEVIAHGRKRQAAFAAHDPHTLTIDVIVPDDVELKMQNSLRNNESGRTVTAKGVYRCAPTAPVG